jgi:hypothetical protein
MILAQPLKKTMAFREQAKPMAFYQAKIVAELRHAEATEGLRIRMLEGEECRFCGHIIPQMISGYALSGGRIAMQRPSIITVKCWRIAARNILKGALYGEGTPLDSS